MSKKTWDDQELGVQGLYPVSGTWYGLPYSPVERLNQPISPAENLLNFYKKQPIEWLPDICSDQIDITPDCNLDVTACGYEGGLDAFGVKWIPVENNSELPAFVEPGFKLLDDVADWRTLAWPDVDSWNWKEAGEEFDEIHKEDNRLRRGVILSGYFERLISIMTFEEAAVSLITDPEETELFFEALTDLNIKIMDHYIDDFKCESIMVHDDWAAQKAPFFSLDTCMSVIVPPLKRLVEHAHKRGVVITLHSCGNATALVPAMKEAGVDAWQANDTALDLPEALRKAEEAGVILEIYPLVPDTDDQNIRKEFIEKMMKEYSADYKGLVDYYEFNPDRLFETRKMVYKTGRELAISMNNVK